MRVSIISSNEKSFAALSFVFALVECTIEKKRGRSDILNGGYAGLAGGAAFGLVNRWKQRPMSMYCLAVVYDSSDSGFV